MSSGRISSWTRFKFPSSESLNPSIFKPLLVGNNNYVHDAYYGPIAEFNGEYILVVIWESRQLYEEFKDSAQYRQLLNNLKADSSSASLATQIIDFDKIAFWWRFGPNTELRTVYFPASLSIESREAVKKLRGLVLTMGLGIDGSKAHLSPYRGVPTCGWTEGTKSWMNQNTISCIWCHYWKDREAERKFKTTETRLPKNMEEDQILASSAFEADLKSFGALGWEDIHVNFKKVPKTI